MFINPKTAIKEGWITYPAWMTDDFRQKCIQPNALDITLDRVFRISPTAKPFRLSESAKHMQSMEEQILQDDNFFIIPPNGIVDCMSDFSIKVAENTAAYLIVRSTLNRNGIFLTSGLYDYGFDNNIGFILHNRSDNPAYIEKGTRVAQLIVVESETTSGSYSGSYNDSKGDHWSNKTEPSDR